MIFQVILMDGQLLSLWFNYLMRRIFRMTVSTMAKRFCLMATCLLAPWALAEDMPSVQDILDKAVESSGGRAAHEAIKTRIAEGSFTLLDMAIEAEFTNYIAPPNVYTDIFMGAFGSVERGLTDGVAWELNPVEGPKVLEGEEADSQKRQAALNEFLDWKSFYSNAKVLGEAMVGDAAAWEIEFTTTAGKKLKHYFDKATGLMVQTVADAVTTTYSEFKETDGVKLPHKIASKGGRYGIEISIASFEHNTEIPADKFKIPETIQELLGGDTENTEAAGESETPAN
jgi:hypothetical protein